MTWFMHLQVKEALALAKGDLDEAERISAEDKLAISEADENPSTEEEPATKSKPKKDVEDSILVDIRKKFADAQAELASVRNSLATAEPATERTAFCDWVREVCKNASDDQFVEFQTNFMQMQAKWKEQQRSAQMPRSTTQDCVGFQPLPTQWRMPPSHLQNVSPWQSQSPEYMQSYMQQPYVNAATSLSSTSRAVSSALLNLDNPDSP